jgi:hypothetical protein
VLNLVETYIVFKGSWRLLTPGETGRLTVGRKLTATATATWTTNEVKVKKNET